MIDALLKGIIEEVGDNDSLRLQYAENLHRCDPDRADFIQIQCKLDKMTSMDPEWKPLSRQMWLLLERHRQKWIQGVETAIPANESEKPHFTFRRGFIEGIHCSPRFFASHAAKIAQLAPIRCLYLTLRDESLETITHCDQLEKIEELGFRWIDIENLARLAVSPFLNRLSRLRLSGKLGAAGAKLIVTSPWVCNLKHLSLSESWMCDAGMAILANCPRLRYLKILDLVANYIGDAGAAALVASPNLESLEGLFLGRYTLTRTLLYKQDQLNPISGSWQQNIRQRFPHTRCTFEAGWHDGMGFGKCFS